MQRALTEPGLGYYAISTKRPTREGDFLTAPELHPLFGRVLGRQLHEMWERLGRPSRFILREYGAGRGTLGAAIRDGLTNDSPAFGAALDHQPVDLGDTSRATPVVGCILANEFLDALPVHRVVQRQGRLREVFVTWADGRFADLEGEPSTSALTDHLAADGVALVEGQHGEICLAATEWMRRASAELDRGYLLIIDYGHDASALYGLRRMAGTLLGYRGHRVVDDVYSDVGRTDLTAHVDLTPLDRAAAASGLMRVGDTRQAAFVAALGLGELLRELGEDRATDPQDYLAARAAVARLLDPRHLGAFRVVAWARGVASEPPLRGFGALR